MLAYKYNTPSYVKICSADAVLTPHALLMFSQSLYCFPTESVLLVNVVNIEHARFHNGGT
jgi:hypothetical protein